MLRLYIEGRWEPEDFIEVFSGVESLYYKAALIRRILSVRRIEYASPGRIDLVGIGEACRAVADVIISLTKFFTEGDLRRETKKQAKIETGIKEAELHERHESLRSLKIANGRALLSLRRDFPEISEEYFTALAAHDQDRLIPRIAEGKLISAKTLGDDAPKDGEADA